VQKIVGACTRETIRDTEAMIVRIVSELAGVEEQWGVRILQLGFSNISPSTPTLEITQLELLAREKQGLYRGFRADGMSEEAAVALVTGAVVAVHAPDGGSLARDLREERALKAHLQRAVERVVEDADTERRGEVDEPAEPGDEAEGEDKPK
jgi:hypothetical protein